jgi:hypothetical protein
MEPEFRIQTGGTPEADEAVREAVRDFYEDDGTDANLEALITAWGNRTQEGR